MRVTFLNRLAALFLFTIVLLSCSSQSTRELVLSEDLAELEQDNSALPALVYIRPGAPDLASYSSFIIDPITVRRTNSDDKLLTEEDFVYAQHYLKKAMVDELQASGYQIVEEPTNETLRISLAISDLKAPISVSSKFATMLGSHFELGGVTISAAFSDPETGRIDAVVMVRSRGESMLQDKPWSNMADIEAAFDHWALGLRGAIDKAHGK